MAGEAIEVPVSETVPHAELACEESVAHPGAQISGLRRPSGGGPGPPVQMVFWLGVSPSLPTARTFLAFSGFLSRLWLVTAKQIMSSSLVQVWSSMARQRASYCTVPSLPQELVWMWAPLPRLKAIPVLKAPALMSP